MVLKSLLNGRPLLLGDQLPGSRLLGGQLGVWRSVLPSKVLVLEFLHWLQLWLDKLGRGQQSQMTVRMFIRQVTA